MQIKKSPRDAEYRGIPPFDASGFEAEETAEPVAAEAFARTARPMPGRAPVEQSGGPERPQTPAARSESVIDRHSSFDGQFETEHDLRVEGTVSGEVICRGLFSVEREATARARVQARDAHIQGRFEGDITCTGKLLLSATASVTGTFKAAVLVVEEGAAVSGNIETAAAQPVSSRPAAAPQPENGTHREPATVTRPARRDLPSFAIVASDERAAADRN